MPERPSVPIELMPGSRMSRWNGTPIALTLDCSTCTFCIYVDENPVCVQGKAWKYLVGKAIRHCETKKRSSAAESSVYEVLLEKGLLKQYVESTEK